MKNLLHLILAIALLVEASPSLADTMQSEETQPKKKGKAKQVTPKRTKAQGNGSKAQPVKADKRRPEKNPKGDKKQQVTIGLPNKMPDKPITPNPVTNLPAPMPAMPNKPALPSKPTIALPNPKLEQLRYGKIPDSFQQKYDKKRKYRKWKWDRRHEARLRNYFLRMLSIARERSLMDQVAYLQQQLVLVQQGSYEQVLERLAYMGADPDTIVNAPEVQGAISEDIEPELPEWAEAILGLEEYFRMNQMMGVNVFSPKDKATYVTSLANKLGEEQSAIQDPMVLGNLVGIVMTKLLLYKNDPAMADFEQPIAASIDTLQQLKTQRNLS